VRARERRWGERRDTDASRETPGKEKKRSVHEKGSRHEAAEMAD
jgi:hypothetical protein